MLPGTIPGSFFVLTFLSLSLFHAVGERFGACFVPQMTFRPGWGTLESDFVPQKYHYLGV